MPELDYYVVQKLESFREKVKDCRRDLCKCAVERIKCNVFLRLYLSNECYLDSLYTNDCFLTCEQFTCAYSFHCSRSFSFYT